jgi:hypothetical protein
MTIQTSLKSRIIAAQICALLPENLPSEALRGMEKQLKQNSDQVLHFMNIIWILGYGDLRRLIFDEAHKSKYSVHPGADKIYQDLKEYYWWPGMKQDVATYVGKCLSCSKVKAEH